jgi:O-methyltransferase
VKRPSPKAGPSDAPGAASGSGSTPAPARTELDPREIDAEARATIERVQPYSMTGEARLLSLIESVRYCVARGVRGDFAECGVWRGGSVLAMILTLQQLGVSDRDVHLFDTFEGMTEPTGEDTSAYHPPAQELWEAEEGRPWQILFDGETNSEGAVREVIATAGYPAERVHFHPGPVEQTLPSGAPERIALLRLDTDWYESTRHELEHLYPRLERGGVLIIDDYGHWDGCRRAVDEYFSTAAEPLLLNRIDYTGRVAVKA